MIFLIPFPRVNRFDHVATIQLSRRIKGVNGIKRIIVFVVVSFGTLPQGTLAQTCTIYEIDDHSNRTKWSDILLNKASFNWTTNPGARSCRSRYDLESVVTHERGHTFGLDHVSEVSHRNLTMSPSINGPCQSSERSLGLGDWRGLDRKYSRGYDPDNPR